MSHRLWFGQVNSQISRSTFKQKKKPKTMLFWTKKQKIKKKIQIDLIKCHSFFLSCYELICLDHLD
jgi:hypothetical protein